MKNCNLVGEGSHYSYHLIRSEIFVAWWYAYESKWSNIGLTPSSSARKQIITKLQCFLYNTKTKTRKLEKFNTSFYWVWGKIIELLVKIKIFLSCINIVKISFENLLLENWNKHVWILKYVCLPQRLKFLAKFFSDLCYKSTKPSYSFSI